MPLINDDNTTDSINAFVGIDENEESQSVSEVVGAAFSLDNELVSWAVSEGGLPDIASNPNYNPWEHLTEAEKGDTRFVENALLADSDNELEALRRQTQVERKNRKMVDQAGVWGTLASVSAGVFDPVNFIPIGGVAVKAYKTGNILKGALTTGAVAAGSASAAEVGLHATQVERTFGESALNISGSFLLGSALGGISSTASKYVRDNAEQLDEEINEIFESVSYAEKPQDAALSKSVSAAQTEQIQVRGKAVEETLKKARFDPLTRLLTSEATPARRIVTDLAASPVEVTGPVKESAEQLMYQYRGMYVKALQGHLKNFKSFRKNESLSSRLRGVKREEFSRMVSEEVRNPGTHDIPEVKSSAKAWVNDLYEPIKKELIELEMLPEGVSVKESAQYLNRIYNKEVIATRYGEFTDRLADWYKKKDLELFDSVPKMKETLDKLKVDPKKNASKIAEIEETISRAKKRKTLGFDDVDYKDIASQTADRIISTPDGRLPYDWKIGSGNSQYGGAKGVKGPLKKRVLNIPDELIQDFLVNDIEMLGARYYRSLSPDIEIKRKFGDVEMEEQLSEIKAYYSGKMNKAKTAKESDRLNDLKNRDIRDVMAIRDRLRGTYNMTDPNDIFIRIIRAAKNLNFLRFMGGVVPSSFPDFARPFMAEGFGRVFSKSIGPLIKDLKSFKKTTQEFKEWGIAVDDLIGGRTEIIAEVSDYTRGGGTKIERGLRSAADNFGKVTLMDYWNTALKQIHAVAMQNGMVDDIFNGKVNTRKMKRLGINEDDIAAMRTELKKHAVKDGRSWVVNAKKWNDATRARLWMSAIARESDRVIVVPGQEKPLVFSTEVGGAVLQFKSFFVSNTHRSLIAGLQGQDANYFGGTMMAVTLGMMSYAFKQWNARRDITDDPKTLVMEGIDRSGILGVFMEVNNTLEKASANNLGLRPSLGITTPAARFASRNLSENMMGPVFGSAFSTASSIISASIDDNEWTERDTQNLRRMVPYQNLFYFRRIVEDVTRGD